MGLSMGDTVFAAMVDDLVQPSESITWRTRISAEQYAQWQKHYSWDALQNVRYGQSFCNYFNIGDNRLFYERNAERCRNLIKTEYLGAQ